VQDGGGGDDSCGDLCFLDVQTGSMNSKKDERFINSTFSRNREVYKSDLLTCSRFTHISTADEGFDNLRGPPGIGAVKVLSTINQPPPSFSKLIPLPEGLGLRTCASEQPFVTFDRKEAISFVAEGSGVYACASGQPSVTFGLQKVIFFAPKVMVFELALLSVHLIPSGTLGSISLGPYKHVREHFRG